MIETRFHELADGRRIAFRLTPGSGPAVVFLPGYMSDMTGGKATAVFSWAQREGRACLLLDYSGCGESAGEFADGTLSRWQEEVLALIHAHLAGPILLVGSSMGGWLMLLVGLALGQRLAGLVGIAAAPDFTDWGYDEADKRSLAAGQTIWMHDPAEAQPAPLHAGFWADGQSNRLLGGQIAIDCPVRLLHGQQDVVVPPEISLRLGAALRSSDVQVTLVKAGDHRLSGAGDIDLLLRTLAAVV